jgi:nucleoside-diphosphate-sugar epimerase
VVLTSSAVASLELTTVPRVFTESSWNEASVEAVKTKGSAAGPFLIYCASKTLAEKAAWEFVAAHKSKLSWDVAVINPSLILGVRLSHPFSLLHC